MSDHPLRSPNLLGHTDFSPIEVTSFFTKFRNSIWLFGIPSWLFGITDRGFSAFADGYVSPIEFFHVMAASLFFISWLYLKPAENLSEQEGALQLDQSGFAENDFFLEAARTRMQELRGYHLISQAYTLPFPYICQIYHLLNLKHLENIHSFSLNNLRVIKISEFERTEIGGKIKFQTVLDSPMNPLRIWRQPIVEVDLTLHTPYTVELSIPVYNEKRIVVIFNAFPVSNTEHKFFVDIYSDLEWFKPFFQLVLHFASCLTLFEDWPYLQTLAERNLSRLIRLGRISNHESMQLFKRFVELYGPSIVPADSPKLLTSTVNAET